MSRVFSGIRPSGRLHLGNYLGAIKNWIALQLEHECVFAIVDYHGITTPFSPEELRNNVREVALDYLAAGLDPKKSILIQQSQVPAHVELGWIFGAISPLSWFEKVPTYKEKIEQHPDYVHLGLLSYPALMAADILIYKAELVPVGEDQLPHIEMTNDIARRFNHMFPHPNPSPSGRGQGEGGNTFPPVKAILTESSRVMSLKDPRKKMSKTPHHSAKAEEAGQAGDEACIFFSDKPETIHRKLKRATTDSGDEIRAGADKPALTNLLTIYSEVSGLPISKLEKQYAGRGYAEFKEGLAEAVMKFLEPIQKRRQGFAKKHGYVEEILEAGAKRARPLAQKTLDEVKKKIGIL